MQPPELGPRSFLTCSFRRRQPNTRDPDTVRVPFQDSKFEDGLKLERTKRLGSRGMQQHRQLADSVHFQVTGSGASGAAEETGTWCSG